VVEQPVAPTAMTDAAKLDLMSFCEIFILSLSPNTAKGPREIGSLNAL